MTTAINHFLYLCSWAGGIFAIGLSLLLLAAIALAGWGWLNTPPAPLPETAQSTRPAWWKRFIPERKRSKLW